MVTKTQVAGRARMSPADEEDEDDAPPAKPGKLGSKAKPAAAEPAKGKAKAAPKATAAPAKPAKVGRGANKDADDGPKQAFGGGKPSPYKGKKITALVKKNHEHGFRAGSKRLAIFDFLHTVKNVDDALGAEITFTKDGEEVTDTIASGNLKFMEEKGYFKFS